MESILKLIFLFVTLFFVFMLILKYYTLFKSKKIIGKNVNIIDDGILYFYSPKCGACKPMEKIISSLSNELNIVRLNVFDEKNLSTVKKLNILATPTTVIVKNGRISKVFIGVVKEEKIRKEVIQ